MDRQTDEDADREAELSDRRESVGDYTLEPREEKKFW